MPNDRNITGSKRLWILALVLNTIICLFGLVLIGCGVYLIAYTQTIHSISFIFIVSGVITMVTCNIQYQCTRYSPTNIIVYQVFSFVIMLTTFTITLFVSLNFEMLIDFMVAKLKDSDEAIKVIKHSVSANLEITQVVGYTVTFIIVLLFTSAG